MTDQLRDLANQYLAEIRRNEQMERDYTETVTNALFPYLLKEYQREGRVKSFEISQYML